MEYIVICLVALLVSALTLFSGFGLGTVLMPAFALFFPVPVAIAATAVVHLANNLFKVVLVGGREVCLARCSSSRGGGGAVERLCWTATGRLLSAWREDARSCCG